MVLVHLDINMEKQMSLDPYLTPVPKLNLRGAWLAQLEGHATLGLRVVSLSLTFGVEIT